MSETSPSRQSPTLATNSPDKKYSKKNIKHKIHKNATANPNANKLAVFKKKRCKTQKN